MFKYITYILLWVVVLLSSASARAQVTAPSQGGEVSLVRVMATSMELRFGMTGTGQGRVVVMAALSSGPSGPLAATDGKFYSASTIYGEGSPISRGYVVYCGTGHSATITGLTPSTYYYITTAEFNRDSSSIAYNTRSSSVAAFTKAGAVALAVQPVTTRSMEVYPNPSAGQTPCLILHGYSNETCNLSLTDVLGKQVINQQLTTTDATATNPLILPQNLTTGAYLLTLSIGNDAPLRKRIIITN